MEEQGWEGLELSAGTQGIPGRKLCADDSEAGWRSNWRESSLLSILIDKRNRFRNMNVESNLGDSYHGMRKLTAPGREKEETWRKPA